MKINYANGVKKDVIKTSKIKSLGMLFENQINLSNEYYLTNNIANIHKKPTPIQVVKVEYPKRSRAKITEAYYRTPSTTDYNGIYKGKYIDFEAKETNSNLFPFKNISIHQINHLLSVNKMGGIAFLIIFFRLFNEVYLLDIKDFSNLKDSGDKSISISKISKLGKKVETGYSPLVNYLKTIDNVYFDTNKEG